mgnify:CR=1 FL=1
MKKTIFKGAGVALVTPFFPDGRINYQKLDTLIERQIDNGTDAIIACGTTGESAALSYEEHVQCVQYIIDVVAKRVPVIAGSGSNDTDFALKISNACEKAGADALLMVTPYYNKTSQDGLIRHYNYVADRVSAPIILYNVPSRTGVNIRPETYFELSKHERIVAAKEANGDLGSIARTRALCNDALDIYSGCDEEITAVMAMGGKGVISVLSNICPGPAHQIATAYLEGDTEKSLALQLKYMKLIDAIFMDVNPIPVKEAMNIMGFQCGECRMPLAPLSKKDHEKMKAVLKEYNLL